MVPNMIIHTDHNYIILYSNKGKSNYQMEPCNLKVLQKCQLFCAGYAEK